MNADAEALILFGTAEPPATLRVLRAGAISAVLDRGQLRYLRIGEVEILRAISFTVRDENWGTDAAMIDDLRIDEAEGSCRVSYRAVCARATASFRYHATIELDASGRIRFAVEGAADAPFTTNRTGFVVLHPIAGVAGRPVEVLHGDGRLEITRFPDLIEPWQPIFDIRTLIHEAAPGLRVACRMDGDAYEMEDQRSWGDASFKTYIRPIARGFPYLLAAGEIVRQSVEVSVESAGAAVAVIKPTAPLRVAVRGRAGAMPAIAIALDASDAAAACAVAETIAQSRVQRLIGRIDMRRGHGREQIAALEAFRQAIAAELTLEIVIPGRDPVSELASVAADAARAGLAIRDVVPSPVRDLRSRPTGVPAGEASIEEILTAARRVFPHARIGGGTLAYFTELTRNRPPAALIDFVTHGFAANIHAADEISIMETLETIPHIARSLRGFMPDKPYRIGFASIAMRESPYGAGPVPNLEGRRVAASRIDPRQRGLVAASWALGFTACASREGIESVALGMPLGPFGLVETSETTGFRLRPIFAVVEALCAAGTHPRRDVAISDPRRVQALAFERGDRLELLLVNLGAEPITVEIEGFTATAMRRLGPYAIAATSGSK